MIVTSIKVHKYHIYVININSTYKILSKKLTAVEYIKYIMSIILNCEYQPHISLRIYTYV